MTAVLRLSSGALKTLAGNPGWPRHLAGLGCLATAILLLFLRDAADMARIWWTSSTYGHILFIPFLIGWLVYQRADGLSQIRPVAWSMALLWLAGGGCVWLLGDAAGLAVLRHGGLIMMLQGAVAACLGPMVMRGLLFPVFYAFFMVPAGSELEPALQLLTAKIAMALLGVMDVPAYIEGIFITIPNGYFKVAEACSGAKFLIAMTAYGVLVCNVCFRSWMRRALFLTGALALCLFANGVRAFATIYVAHLTSVDVAAGFDHVVYGWLFFAIVIAGIMLAAWPFFDRKPDDPAFDVKALREMRVHGQPLPLVVGGGLLLALAVPLWSHAATANARTALAKPILPDIAGWRRIASPMASSWKPRFNGADHLVMARYTDGQGRVVDLAVAAYARQSEGRELIAFGQGAATPDNGWSWSADAWAPAYWHGEIITAPGPVRRHVVSFYRVGQAPPTGSATRVKLATMRARLLGQDQRSAAILISAEDKQDFPAGASIRAFLAAMDDPEDLADAVLRTR